jgi:ABC-type sugar transport system substrate-binding protein
MATLRLKAVKVLAVAVAASFAVAGISTPAQAANKYTIAFVMGAESDPFFQAMKLGAEQEAAAKGVTLVWQGDPSVYSPATQNPILDQVLALKPNGLVLIPTDPTALQAGHDKAITAGIPVVNVDTHVDNTSKAVAFITGDNADGGAKAADTLAKAIGYKKGKTYKVVVGLTSATATTNVGRLNGFSAQIKKMYPGIKIVDKAYSQSQPSVANTNVSNWLTKYPDLAGIFAIDGTNAAGAAAALQAKGLTGKIKLIGYDAYPANVDLIKKGVFTALIAQDPAQEARLAIDYLVATLSKDAAGIAKIKHDVVIPNVVLTAKTSAADLKKYTYVAK